MKHSLGKLFVLMIMLFTCLNAEDFSFTTRVDAANPYVKEPVFLSVDLNQTNHDIVLLFTFDLKPSPDYTFRRVDSKVIDSYHDAKVHYLYLLYPLKSGTIEVRFDLVKRITNDESVKESFAGDRDTVKFLETKNSKAKVPPLVLHVKPLPEGTKIVGDFKLHYDIGKTSADAYEPIPFKVTVSGTGYPPLISPLIKANRDFTLFSEKPIVTTDISPTSPPKSSVVYPMALSAGKSFKLPTVTIKAFDPKKERSYLLQIPETAFTITAPDVNTLVDKTDNPPPLRTDWGWLGTLMGYLFAFGAGFASAWLLKWQRKQIQGTEDPLIEKIDTCKEKKALLQLLLAHDATTFAPVIDKLEADLYGGKTTPLKTLKQEAKERLT